MGFRQSWDRTKSAQGRTGCVGRRHTRGRRKVLLACAPHSRDLQSWRQLSGPTLTLRKSEGKQFSGLPGKYRDMLHTKLCITFREIEGGSGNITLTQPQSSVGLRLHLLR